MSGQSSLGATVDRRRFLAVCTAVGLGQTMLPGALLALAQTSAGTAPVAGAEGHGDVLAGLPEGAGFGEDGKGLPKITVEMIEAAAGIAGVTLTAEQRAMMLEGLGEQRDAAVAIRKLHLPNAVAPAFVFDPVLGGERFETVKRPVRISAAPDVAGLAEGAKAVAASSGGASAGSVPVTSTTFASESQEERLAFATVRELAELVRLRKVSSVELVKLYLGRLRKYDPRLHFVITLTEQRAMDAAAAADREIAAGRYRGPLHGIPWGAKDLLAVKGYPTTWGAAGFEGQVFDYDATVVERLDAAGAVPVAKLTLGALAQGDLWGYPAGSGKAGGRTRNPWNVRQGSSGSSAGVASAVSAGCVGFGIGSETLGSISSPSTRCGVTGLRPTFGFVPRTGAMALSWTMDKLGPICRSAEDCALVMSAIYGPDGKDRTVRKDAVFNWDADLDWKRLRIGYVKEGFDAPAAPEPKRAPEGMKGKELEDFEAGVARGKARFAEQVYDQRFLTEALAKLRGMGVTLVPVEWPKFPYGEVVPVLEAEGAAAFDELTRSGRDALLSGQKDYDWPTAFRVARFYSAVEYVQAMRARTLAMEAVGRLFETVDVVVAPTFGTQLVATNLTGQPAVIVPNGVRGTDAPAGVDKGDGDVENEGGPGTPVSLTFLGGLYRDAEVLAVARGYEGATGFGRVHPVL